MSFIVCVHFWTLTKIGIHPLVCNPEPYLESIPTIFFPLFRKHERKGIARRVSNFSSEGESVSPDIPVVVPGQAFSIPPSSFPVQVETSPTSNFHEFSNPLVSISVADAMRSHSPVVVHPSVQPNFHMWNGSISEQQPDSPANPPTMATGVFSPLPQPTPVVLPSRPHHHPSQSSQGHTLNSSQISNPSIRGILVDGQSTAPPPPIHMTRSKNALGQSPPLVVHLKDRGEYANDLLCSQNWQSLAHASLACALGINNALIAFRACLSFEGNSLGAYTLLIQSFFRF